MSLEEVTLLPKLELFRSKKEKAFIICRESRAWGEDQEFTLPAWHLLGEVGAAPSHLENHVLEEAAQSSWY